MPVAAGAVDLQPPAHRWPPCGATRGDSRRSGATTGRPPATGRRPRTGRPQPSWARCRSVSPCSRCRPDVTNRAAPSGCAQAPRPATERAWAERGADRGPAGGQRRDVGRQRRQPEVARPALLGRFAGQPVGDPGQLAQRAGALVDDEQDAGAERTAGRCHPFTPEPDRRDRCQPRAVVAADDDRLRFGGGLGRGEDDAERRPERDLDDPRAPHRATHGEQRRPRLGGRAGVGEAVRAEAQQDGDLGEGLGVGHQRSVDRRGRAAAGR